MAIVGTGYVADLYMRSRDLHPDIQVAGAFDIRQDRLAAFCNYWNLTPFASLSDLLRALPKGGIVLNLTNPAAHHDVTRACLEADHHVYSEKPLAMELGQARELVDLARRTGKLLGGAPCSHLSEAAQTLATATRTGTCGPVRLVYAELDDGFIPQAPHQKWLSESGAPWPYENEMQTGCTLEHAGYVLTWLVAMFGSIHSITAFSAATVDKGLEPECRVPDTSIGILKFRSGPIVRLTCTIVAPHDHRVLLTGDRGTLEVRDTWDNNAKVHFRRRFVVRRRLLESPIPRRLRLAQGPAGRRAKRRGAASMDFLLGPEEMFRHLSQGGVNRCADQMALHVTEAALHLQNAGEASETYLMQTACDPVPAMEWAGSLR
ncbi:Gfo/Idh/MocA family oxidoreductase [Defluviimonas sp. WL0002]|uniref:Gfo/Idh/MocA family oxidoreductase n=1 Tax=Albidovulum marisflavi TaxID=2984159 RepID=A0ABT2ZDT2_9RHOB|nr:Gfo/Idh/MocA family oxidoreductase [Defluviimonas sp. WL0002]MCV2868906.1 Gfo/Idh/MocA family oxidoreductase [Defluviimonas sp. WL0002]